MPAPSCIIFQSPDHSAALWPNPGKPYNLGVASEMAYAFREVTLYFLAPHLYLGIVLCRSPAAARGCREGLWKTRRPKV